MNVRYGVGVGTAVAGAHSIALIDGGPSDAVALEISASTAAGERAAEALSRLLALGLGDLGSFGWVVVEDGRAHIVLRGEVQARVDTHDGSVHAASGAGLSTWREHVFDDVVSIVLSLGAVVGDGNLPFELQGGTAPAGSIAVTLTHPLDLQVGPETAPVEADEHVESAPDTAAAPAPAGPVLITMVPPGPVTDPESARSTERAGRGAGDDLEASLFAPTTTRPHLHAQDVPVPATAEATDAITDADADADADERIDVAPIDDLSLDGPTSGPADAAADPPPPAPRFLAPTIEVMPAQPRVVPDPPHPGVDAEASLPTRLVEPAPTMPEPTVESEPAPVPVVEESAVDRAVERELEAALEQVPEPEPEPEPEPAPEPEPVAPDVWPPPPPAAGSDLDEAFGELLGATRAWSTATPPAPPTPPEPTDEGTGGPPTSSATPSPATRSVPEVSPSTRPWDDGTAVPPVVAAPPAPPAPPARPAPPRAMPHGALPAAPPHASATPATPAPPVAPGGAPPASGSGFISSLPTWGPPRPGAPGRSPGGGPPAGAPPAPTAPPAPASTSWSGPADEDPLADVTVARGRRPTAPTAGAPPIQAVHCAAGHPNPLYADRCRQCNGPIEDRIIVTIPRPPLGTLVFDDGTRVTLDGPMLLGRKPSVSPAQAAALVRPIAVADPDHSLSRSHLEVRVAEWQVQIVDCDSMNGSFVEIAGRAPFRLHPGEAYPVPIGCSVTLGDQVRFVLTADPR
jgi:hypothetical protein